MSTLPTQYVYAGRVLLTVLVINWSGLLAYVSNAQSATDSPNQAPSPANPRQDTDEKRDKKLAKPQADESKKIVENMENSFKVLEAAEAEIPRDTFDAQAIVSKVGKDPNNLFEWVRDNTFWVPYRGSLRGSLGVLMDRLGNSLDRSLLLAELLHVAGHEVRLAHAEISPDQGKELLPKLRPVPDVPVPPGVWATYRPEGAELDTYAAGYHLDAAELRESSKRTSMATANLTKQVTQRTGEETQALVKLLGPLPTRDRDKEQNDCIHALQEHWWLQVHLADQWVDFDPLLPDSRSGDSLVKPARTVAPDGKTGRLVLDERDYQQVEIRVVIEQVIDKKRTEKVVLRRAVRPAEMFGRRISLKHWPVDWPNDILKKADLEKRRQSFKAAVARQDYWLPMLEVGRSVLARSSESSPALIKSGMRGDDLELVAEAGFYDSGEVNKNAFAEAKNSFGARNAGKSVANLLSGGGIGLQRKKEDVPKSKGVLTAEWLEYEIRIPGSETKVIRRKLFDLAGETARRGDVQPGVSLTDLQRQQRSLALLGEVEILPFGCQFSPAFVEYLMIEKMLANRSVLPAMIRKISTGQRDEIKASDVTPVPDEVYWFAVLRGRWSHSAGNLFYASPNLVARTKGLGVSETGDPYPIRVFDIAENRLAVGRGTDSDPFLLQLEQGVLDTNTEFFISPKKTAQNTGEMFAQTEGRKQPWQAIRALTDAALGNEKSNPEARALMQKDVADGNIIVAPKEPTVGNRRSACWWRIDPKTGQCLGMGEWGGQTSTEEKLVNLVVVADIAVSHVLLYYCLREIKPNSSSESCEQLICMLGFLLDFVGGSLFEMDNEMTGGKELIGAIGGLLVGVEAGHQFERFGSQLCGGEEH